MTPPTRPTFAAIEPSGFGGPEGAPERPSFLKRLGVLALSGFEKGYRRLVQTFGSMVANAGREQVIIEPELRDKLRLLYPPEEWETVRRRYARVYVPEAKNWVEYGQRLVQENAEKISELPMPEKSVFAPDATVAERLAATVHEVAAGLVSTAPSLAAAVAFRQPALALGAAGFASYQQNKFEVSESLKQDVPELTEEQREKIASATALPMAALDLIPIERFAKGLRGTDHITRQVARQIARNLTEVSLAEGVTEGTQSLIEQSVTGALANKPLNIRAVLEEGFIGSLTGAIYGGVGEGAVRPLAQRRAVRELERALTEQAVDQLTGILQPTEGDIDNAIATARAVVLADLEKRKITVDGSLLQELEAAVRDQLMSRLQMPPAPGGPPPRGGVPPSRPPSPPTSPPTGTAPPSPAPPTGGVPPSPPTGGVPPSPPTGGVPPSPPTGGVPPSPPTGGVPPSPPTGGVPPSLPTGVLPPPPPTGGVPPSPPTGGVPPSLPTGVLPPPPPTGVLPPPPPTGGVSPTPGVPPPPGGETPQTTPDVSPEVELRRRLGEISDPALVEELLGLYVDALTGLGNARAFEKAMSRAQALNLGVLGLDITNFKALNDLLDWQAGNAALKDVARLLTDAAKATGFPGRNIFRVGGDEFAVIGKQDDLQRLEAEIRGRLPSFERKVGDYNVGLRLARGQDWSAVFEELKGLKPKEQGPRYRDLGVPGQRYGDEGVVGPTEYRDPVSGLPNASALQVAKPRLQKPDYEFLRLSLLTTDTRDASSEVDKRLIATVGRVLAAELGRDAFHITPTSFLLWGPAPKLPLVKEHVFDALRDFLKAIPARRGQVFEVAVETRTAADRAGLSQTEQIFVPEHTEGRPDVTPPPPDVDVYVPEPTTADEYEALIRAAIADRNFDGATSLLMSALTVFPTDSRWGALLEENERARKEFTDGSVSAEQGQGPPAVGAVPTGLHPTAVQGVAETEVGGTPVPGASGTGPTGQLPTPVGATVEGVAAGGKPPEAVPVGGALPGVAPPHDVGVVPEPEAPGGVRVPGGVGTAALTNYRASAEDYSPVPRSQIIEDQARALALLDALEREGRRATPEEQALLARFRGWGTVRHADPSWGAKQFARALTQHGLAPEKIDKILKTVERYPASALTGFYTSPVLVTKIWALVQKLGFKGGRVLEPSAGSGRFITLAPEGLPVAVTAVELDPYSSAVLRHLLPQARVVNQAFQQAPLPSGTFDLVIGNVPFAEVRVPDPDPDLDKLSLHNYFIAKSLKLVRPGGLVALITSTYSMDSKTQAHREFWARNAELLYALRLPAEAHEGELTSVESDLLVFRRLLPNEKPPAEPDFLEAPSGRNEYWDKHPERVLASRARGERPQPMRGVVAPFRVGGEPRRLPADTDLGKLFDEILNEVPERVLQQEPVATANLDAAVAGAGGVLSQYQEGSFVETPSGLRQIINGQVREPEVRPASHARVSMLVRLKERVRSLLRLELSDAPDSEIEQARTELRQTYRSFVDQFGRLLEEGNLEGFESDPDYGLVAALEYEAPDGGYAEADILTRRVLQPAKKSGTLSIDEAYAIARARGKGEVDLDLVAELSGQDLQHVLQALEGRIYNDPATKRWIPADVYLAGNLPLKIEEAELAAQTDPQYQKNVEALRRRLPKQKTANEIQWRLGPGWIEESVLKRFLEWLAQEKGGSWQAYKLIDRVSLEYVAPLGVWKAEAAALNRILRNLGTESVPFSTILRHALNNTEPRVYRKVGDKSVLDVEATYLAKQRVDELHQYFNEYVTSVPAVGERLANRFNALLSSSVPYEPVTDWLRFPGLASTVAGQPFELMDHQKKEIAFLLVNGGRGLVSTQAGGGKTYSLIVTGMLLRQHGITKRPPLFVVPNQTLHQFTYQFRAIYPGARILAATAADLQPEKRAAFIARVATGNWDAVVMPYTAFARIPVSPDFAAEVVADELRKLRQALESSREESERRAGPTERAILRRLAALEARLEGLRRGPKERGIWFEDLGIDQIIVDEAHNFKNLPVSSALIQTAESARAWDLYLKARYVQSLRGNSGLILATGTPLANSIAEIHNYLRYLAPDLLAERGMEHLDQWLTNFAKRTTTVDLTVEGAYRPQSYIGPFVNLSELIRMWRQVAIGHHLDALPDIQRPKASVRNEVVPLSPEIKDFYQEIYARAQKIRSGLVKRSVDNLLKLSTEARLGAISLALVDPERWRFDPANGKLPAAAQKIVEYYSEFPGLVQLVFLDYGVPGSKLNLYEELRGLLVARGIPLHEIAFVHEAQGRDAERLFAKVREGKVRVIVGSTQKGGLGLNIQDRLKVIHNIDYPLRAVDLVQRHARMVRQGNQNKEVLIVNYVQEGSFDAYLMRILERKAQVMEQIATGRLGAQELVQVEDIGSRPLTFAEIKALAAGDPRLLKRAELEQVQIELELRLHTLQRDLREIEHRLGPLTELGERLEEAGTYIAGLEAAKAKLKPKGEFRITLEGRTFENRQDAENFIASAEVGAVARPLAGEFLGLPIEVRNDGLNWIVAFSLEEPLGSDEVKISSPLTKFDHKTVNKRVIDEIGRLPAMLDEVLAFYRDRAGKLAVAGQQRQRIEQDIRAVEAKLAEVAQEIEKLSQALEFGTAPRIEEVLSDEELPPPDPDVDLEPDDPRAYVVPTYPDEETEVDLVEELNLAVATAYPQVAERANAVILGQQIELLPLPREQLVQLVWPLLGQQKIRVVRKLRIKDALGVFYGSKRRIDVLATVAGNPQLANMVLAHEIGHLVDFLPQGTLKRGNILGHIAAMRNYLKHTLVLPGGTPVPQAVRNRLKAMAAVQTVALMGPKPKQPGPQLRAWMDVYQKLYTDLLNDELKSRNVVGLAKVKEELIALSEFWRGEITDEQRAYRVQPDELFADAISVLLLSPGTLANKAPTFWNALLAFAKARVGFWQDYLAIQGLVRDQEARLRVIREASRADYELAEHHRHAARAVQRQARQKAKWRWLRELFSAPGSTLERAYKALTGTKAPPWALERALNLLQQEWLNRDAPNVAFVERIREEVFEPLHQLLGQDLQDAGVILVAQRIALGDRAYWAREAQERIQQLTNISDPQRAIEVYKEWAETNPDDFDPGLLELALSEKFNPYGLTFETAKELLEDFARRWGYAKYHRVIELLAHFRELVYEHAVQPAIDAGLVSPRHLATITRNRETYVPFQVVDYYHGYVPPGIMAQYGTVKGIVNPLQSYTLKALALRRLAVQNRLRRGFMEVLVNTPSFTSPEDYGPEVPVVSGVRPNPRPGYSAIWYAKDGMWYFREVESWLAASLERTPLGLAHSLARWFNSFSYGLFHPLLVVWRAAFTARNVLVRDPWRNLRNMAAVISETKGTSPFVASFMSFWFLLRGYAKTFGPAFRSAALGSYEDVVIQALQEGALPARFFISGALADQGYLTIDELAEKTGLFVGPKVEPVSAAVRRVLRSSGLLGGPIRALALLGSHFWKNVLPKFPALSWLARAGMMGEVWHKLGPWYVLKHYLPSLEPSQRAYITLNLFGTPNPAQAGVFPEGWNLALGYGAVAWSGLRTDLGLYGSPRTRAGVLFMDSVVLFLRLLTLAALLGYLGEELREMYRHIPDWVKANRLVIPLGWVGSGSERRVRYIAIPVADVYRGPWTLLYWLGVHSARLATAPFKYLTRSFGAFKREEFPGLNPMLDLVRKWVSFMSGVNPPDELSGRPVVPQRTFEAGDFGSFRQMLYATLYDFGVVADVTMAAARLVPITGFEEELVPYRPREFDDLLFTVLNAATGMVDESRRGLDDEIAREVEWLETVGVQFPVSRPVRQALRRRYQLSRLGPGRRTPEQQDELNGLNDWYRDYYLPWRDIWFLADSLGDSGWKEKAMEELKESTKLIAPSVGRLRPPARPPALRTVPGPRSRLVPR